MSRNPNEPRDACTATLNDRASLGLPRVALVKHMQDVLGQIEQSDLGTGTL
jgi:hypothetical protein